MPQYFTSKGPFDERYAVFQAKWKSKVFLNYTVPDMLNPMLKVGHFEVLNDFQMKMHLSSEYIINSIYTCSILIKQKDDVVNVTGPVAASLKCSRFSDEFDYPKEDM